MTIHAILIKHGPLLIGPGRPVQFERALEAEQRTSATLRVTVAVSAAGQKQYNSKQAGDCCAGGVAFAR